MNIIRCSNEKISKNIFLLSANQPTSNGTEITPYDRVNQRQQYEVMNAAERIKDGANTSAAGTVEVMQMNVEIMNSICHLCRTFRITDL